MHILGSTHMAAKYLLLGYLTMYLVQLSVIICVVIFTPVCVCVCFSLPHSSSVQNCQLSLQFLLVARLRELSHWLGQVCYTVA